MWIGYFPLPERENTGAKAEVIGSQFPPWRNGASHRRLIEEKTRVFLGQLLATPKAFREHIDLLVPLPYFPNTVEPAL
jgi:hypothetical protein